MKKNRVKRNNERGLEVDCCTYARQKGVIAVKLEKNAHKGIPDYMFIAKGGATMFVEFKRPDGKGIVSDEQRYWADFLGYSHRFIDNFEDFKKKLDDFFDLEEYECGEKGEWNEIGCITI